MHRQCSITRGLLTSIMSIMTEIVRCSKGSPSHVHRGNPCATLKPARTNWTKKFAYTLRRAGHMTVAREPLGKSCTMGHEPRFCYVFWTARSAFKKVPEIGRAHV